MVIDEALSHAMHEFRLDNVRPSLEAAYDEAQKGHDAIHEFMLLAGKLFPSTGEVGWESRSAFLTYHWEAFEAAHRSLLEALCGFYNPAFILLRSTLELLIKGAFFEGLAHQEFRNSTETLRKDDKGKRLIDCIEGVLRENLEIGSRWETTSAGIYDAVGVLIKERKFRPPMPVLVEQIFHWAFLEPIHDWKGKVYGLYGKLSGDVHVEPDRTDIGRVLLLQPDWLFKEKEVIPEVLKEYLDFLRRVVDIGVVIELNVLIDNARKYEEVRFNLSERVPELEALGLSISLERLRSLWSSEEAREV